MPAPMRLKSKSTFSDLDSFDAYAKPFKEDDSVIYLDEENRKFKIVFDHHGKDKPTWGEHTASLKLFFSNEWTRFKKMDGEKMKPKEFAEFIEDNINYLSAEGMSAADLITLSENFRINVKGDVEVEDTLHAGMRKLVIKDDSTISSNTPDGRVLTIPPELKVKMRFFKNGTTYDTKVFLRYRISQGSLYFYIKIPDPEGIEEEALNAFSEKVAEKTELKVLKGTFS